MSKTTIPTGGITADAIDATLIADDAISEEHLDATAITGHTALEATPADTDELIISDAGTLKRVDFSHLKGGGMDLIAAVEGTNSVGDISINDCFSATYHTYLVTFNFSNDRAGNTVNFRFQADDDSTFNNNYAYALHGYQATNSVSTNLANGGSTVAALSVDALPDNTGGGVTRFGTVQGFLYIYNPYELKVCKFTGRVTHEDGDGHTHDLGIGGALEQISYKVAGIRFRPSANYITNRRVLVYGLKDS